MQDNFNNCTNQSEMTSRNEISEKESQLFFEGLNAHLTEILGKFQNRDYSSITTDEIVACGRTDEEKEQIREACQEEDEKMKMREELDDYIKENPDFNTPEKWLEKKIDENLADCTKEGQEMIRQCINRDIQKELEEQVETTEKLIDNVSGNNEG